MINIIGLGYEVDDITKKAEKAIAGSDYVVVRTSKTATYDYFLSNEIINITLDSIYDSSDNFDELSENIVSFFKSIYSNYANICYCVDGSGLSDRTVLSLKKHFDCNILPGVSSFENSVANAFNSCDFSHTLSYCAVSSYDFIEGYFDWNRELDLVVYEIDNPFTASDIVLKLQSYVGDECEILVCSNDCQKYPLCDIPSSVSYNYKTSFIVPAQNLSTKTRYNFADLIKIMSILRGENGCMWDKEQTHESIRKNLIEEANELVEAINNDDIDNIIEECGDVLLQSIFHAKIAEDSGEFELSDVLSTLGTKLVSRHTHIFGDDKAESSEQALEFWRAAKLKEKLKK